MQASILRHCTNLVAQYERAALEYEGLASLHRRGSPTSPRSSSSPRCAAPRRSEDAVTGVCALDAKDSLLPAARGSGVQMLHPEQDDIPASPRGVSPRQKASFAPSARRWLGAPGKPRCPQWAQRAGFTALDLSVALRLQDSNCLRCASRARMEARSDDKSPIVRFNDKQGAST